ncbi:MAG: cupin domain-containing protein [Hyphomonadaceae bacterium]|nr:cupin domain-containing protein [Hyphomonadaceae bacterium]
MIDKINIDEKFGKFTDHWRPKIVSELNGQEFKLVKIKGEYPWHAHADADEMFFVWKGEIMLEFRSHTVDLKAGEAIVVPKGVEHRPVADNEAEIFLIEPKSLNNNGDTDVDEKYDAPNNVWI